MRACVRGCVCKDHARSYEYLPTVLSDGGSFGDCMHASLGVFPSTMGTHAGLRFSDVTTRLPHWLGICIVRV